MSAPAHLPELARPLLRLDVPTDWYEVPGDGSERPREATVYVKGFMSSGETEDDFREWAASHGRLCRAHAWQPDGAYGYQWNSHGQGYSPSFAFPVPAFSTAAAMGAMRLLALARPGPLIAAGLAADVLTNAGRLAVQFHTASTDATRQAEVLAEVLHGLRKEHDTVRLVAHSLGCKKAVAACGLLHRSERPDELHLCAAALPPEELTRLARDPAAAGLARKAAHLYYADSDLVLALAFRVLAGGKSAVGCSGLADLPPPPLPPPPPPSGEREQGGQPGDGLPGAPAVNCSPGAVPLQSHDVSAHFRVNVHNGYAAAFGQLCYGEQNRLCEADGKVLPPTWAEVTGASAPPQWDADAIGAVASMIRTELRFQGLLPK
eukprot:SAG22_NODE_26_length_29806_cov_19.885381_10_plen_377_part_00